MAIEKADDRMMVFFMSALHLNEGESYNEINLICTSYTRCCIRQKTVGQYLVVLKKKGELKAFNSTQKQYETQDAA